MWPKQRQMAPGEQDSVQPGVSPLGRQRAAPYSNMLQPREMGAQYKRPSRTTPMQGRVASGALVGGLVKSSRGCPAPRRPQQVQARDNVSVPRVANI